MIPFDPDALLAMLRAFYPIVGPAALLRARAERPDYFAGGEIRGTEGDKLWLADGRKYDLIFKVGAPDTHWQVLLLEGNPGDPAPDDPFALEDGPLAPIDLSAFPELAHVPIFAPLVADALAALGGADNALVLAHTTISDAADPAALEAAYAETLGDTDDALNGSRALIDLADPSDVLATTAGHGGVIDTNAGVFTETGPDDMPGVPEPPPTPPPDVPVPDVPLP